jgi:hypothetical protein
MITTQDLSPEAARRTESQAILKQANDGIQNLVDLGQTVDHASAAVRRLVEDVLLTPTVRKGDKDPVEILYWELGLVGRDERENIRNFPPSLIEAYKEKRLGRRDLEGRNDVKALIREYLEQHPGLAEQLTRSAQANNASGELHLLQDKLRRGLADMFTAAHGQKEAFPSAESVFPPNNRGAFPIVAAEGVQKLHSIDNTTAEVTGVPKKKKRK